MDSRTFIVTEPEAATGRGIGQAACSTAEAGHLRDNPTGAGGSCSHGRPDRKHSVSFHFN